MIECMKFKTINKGALVGYADLFVDSMGLEIFGCAVFDSNGRKWLSMPAREYKDAEGNSKYIPLLRFRNKQSHEAFCRQGWAAVEEYERKMQSPVSDYNENSDILF